MRISRTLEEKNKLATEPQLREREAVATNGLRSLKIELKIQIIIGFSLFFSFVAKFNTRKQ